jgi:Fe-S cluster assembly iron-binding protein IscA/acetyl esterase/lipase
MPRLLTPLLLALALIPPACAPHPTAKTPDISPEAPKTPGPTPGSTPTPSPTAKGRERKNLIELTPRAAARVKEIVATGQKDGALPAGLLYLRVRVADGGQTKLDLDPDTNPADDLFGESRGVMIVVDRRSATSIQAGTRVDFLEGPGESGFKISVPLPALGAPDAGLKLAEARRGFKTNQTPRAEAGEAPPQPPAHLFRLVKYDSPVGKLAAYLTPDPKDGKKRPAIIWITGGDCNSIDQGCWKEAPASNDQSAAAYRKAGVVMMFPSLRGGNDNPGAKESFLGEADDILAALDYLQKQPHVDPNRVYLGGHSTGGTMALLVSESTDRFRAVFSFGPVENILGYGRTYCPFGPAEVQELRLRAPGLWLHSIRSPTFVIEGASGGNADSLRAMADVSKNAKVQFFEVKGANHFSVLAPVNRLLAQKILADSGPECNITLTQQETARLFGK